MSNINELLTMKGELEIILLDPSLKIKQHVVVPNLVVTAGKNVMANYLAKGTTINNAMSHMALGTGGATVPAAGQTALTTELFRKAFNTTSSSNNVASFQGYYIAGEATGNLSEAGIFNASSGGTMLCRTTFNAVYKDTNDILTINWNVTIN